LPILDCRAPPDFRNSTPEHFGLFRGVGRLSRLFKSRVLPNTRGTKHHVFSNRDRINAAAPATALIRQSIFQKRVFFRVLRVGVEPELSTQKN